MESYIPLERQFSPVPKSEEDAESDEILSFLGPDKPKTWDQLDHEFRCVILAEAGAGKTEEMRKRASVLLSQGKPAFFVRIEDIETDFYKSFEIGEENQFNSWLHSSVEAWFFLDSVDEARLENPRAFEKALRHFAKGIKNGAHRAHIYITSRPYAWRLKEDRRLLDNILFLPAHHDDQEGEEDGKNKPKSALTIHVMRPLDRERIRRFCVAYAANDIDQLLRAIERANLWSLAERPFDLEGILAKLDKDNELGGRLELLRHNIDNRLRDDHNIDRAQRQPLNMEQARQGARRLAAAVVLTGKPGLNVPGSAPDKPGIEAEVVLSDWDPKDVRTLLERGLFNDVIYNAVRFRHRDVRELLAAEWFNELLKAGNSRYAVENLFFRERYGEKIVAPRLRPILPWFILFDDEIRRRSLVIHPEIAIEGGDPSRLPLSERQRILRDIVRRIVAKEDGGSARDNGAIARIASSDLTENVQQLIDELADNDDAIFFLGRLVWQGEMVSCIPPLVAIAVDSMRGIYARIASARAVMTCGSVDQQHSLWDQLNICDVQIPRDLLAELIQEAVPNSINITQLLMSLGKLTPYDRYKTSGLNRALRKFVERFPILGNQPAISQFLDGLHVYLKRQPYVMRRECHVSKEYAWLLNIAAHLVERLIESRNPVVFRKTSLSIMSMVPVMRFWRDAYFREYKGNMQSIVPAWPELNDALYWVSIEQARAAREAKSSKPLTDDGSVSWLGHFWSFDTDSLPRLLDYMRSRTLQDDRLVALSTAFRVYVQADRPKHILNRLQNAVAEDSVLRHQLGTLLNPPVSETMKRYDEEHAEYLRKRDEEEEREKQARYSWILELRANPDRVRNPPNIKPGEFTMDQYWLMIELQDRHSATNRSEYALWQALIPDFGEAVAHAYRDAAVNHWRHYLPNLRSEGAKNNGTPYSLIFAMAGLEIESNEIPEFPGSLDEAHVRHALRYITWELNGFPIWLERVHQAFPALVEEAVIKELLWELENTDSDRPMHYILSDLVYHAPRLHSSIAPVIMDWVKANPSRINSNREYCLHIMINGGTDTDRIVALACQQVAKINDPDIIAWWYALWVDCEPENAIPEIDQWLSDLDREATARAAQIFVTTLMGDKHAREVVSNLGNFHTAKHLKALYVLMHQYIRAKEDINRAGGDAYSPTLRDDAQDARNRLLNLLSGIPGKASYTALKQLVLEHPDPNYRFWMAKRAYERAEEDGDLEPWSAEQVAAFGKSQTITPVTHRQLFDLAVHRLIDLKNWLERGNDSPWQTWQRVNGESEMRTLIAGWLNQHCRDQYTTAQEPELANSQRMDIWLNNTIVRSPVPIELKLLDKGWTGPKLCERLRNQLVGDYLREESAGCGVMLLVSQKINPDKRWVISGRRVNLYELADALKLYWQSIADTFLGIEEIDVIVIDLAMRAHVCDA